MNVKCLSIVHALVLLLTTGLRAGEIHEAVGEGNLDRTRALIEADPSLLESKDDGGNTPLHQACMGKQMAIANYLLNQGANVNARNNYGFTPFLHASAGRIPDIEMMEALLAKGADINAKLDRGLTALHFSAMSGNLPAIKFLVERGVDLEIYDRGCYGTALHIAINLGGNPEVVKYLVKQGADINRPFSFDNTPLHLVSIKGYTDLARFLVEQGADVNAANEYRHTAIYYATKLGHRSTADALLALGARQSDIMETNYGKAPQLTEKLQPGEAYLWYLNGFYGASYAVKTPKHLLIFDKTEIDDSAEAGLANGCLNPQELTGQDITLLSTKVLHFDTDPNFFNLSQHVPGIDFVTGFQPSNKSETVSHHLAVAHETLTLDDIKVHTITACGHGNGGGQGLGYLVEADGLKILHAGFHCSDKPAPDNQAYREEIEYLKSFGPIDIAFLTVGGHLWVNYQSYFYLIDELKPQAVYLTGGDQATEQYPNCVKALRGRDIEVAYPEAGIATGQRFHYERD